MKIFSLSSLFCSARTLAVVAVLVAIHSAASVAIAQDSRQELPGPQPAPSPSTSAPVQPVKLASGIENLPLGKPRDSNESAPAPTPSSPLTDPGNLTTLGSLLLVLALIGATAWVIKRSSRNGTLMSALGAGGRAPAGILEVLGRYPISASSTLVMLKVDRRILLIAQNGSGRGGLFGSRTATPGSMQTLSEITDPEDVASILMKVQDDESRAANERFQGLLGQAEREQVRIERRAERRGGLIDSVDLRQTPLAPRRASGAATGTGKVTA